MRKVKIFAKLRGLIRNKSMTKQLNRLEMPKLATKNGIGRKFRLQQPIPKAIKILVLRDEK